ncbi:hypothetical protein [Colwellia sp. Bg11-28]|uniref:hypothetical protein n=1 Tax=Colwellia sp. Bg11-28 TaxID=2058305 RepID=UPI000C329A37|nr:hypothetical protein [Colwellia sp. Bg11-28]PKH89561.1 hypothetical protein CXF79_01925 [Colwellia sp. Bg11-28]
MRTKHSPETLKTLATSAFDGCAWELAVAFISGVFSLVSYHSGFGILFFPMFAVFCLSIFSILLNVFYVIKAEIIERILKKQT